MKRSDFFKVCTGGVCGCAVLGIAGPLTSEASVPMAAAGEEDWRIGFIQERYSKLIDILGEQLGEEKRNQILELQGRECAKHFYDRALKFKGNLKGYLDDIKIDWFEKVEYDEPIRNIRITDKLVKKCACPFVDISKMKGGYCHCTIGWQKEIYSLVSGKEVEVELESSVLRGGEKCIYRIIIKES